MTLFKVDPPIEVSLNNMNATLFAAGLGDVIRVIYLRNSYQHLSTTETPTAVIVASHNPFAIEIFTHHRNAKNFIIYELGHKYIEFLRAGMKGEQITRALLEFCPFAGRAMTLSARLEWESLGLGQQSLPYVSNT
jgi:hypothetical protein